MRPWYTHMCAAVLPYVSLRSGSGVRTRTAAFRPFPLSHRLEMLALKSRTSRRTMDAWLVHTANPSAVPP